MKQLDVSCDDVEPPDWLPDLSRAAATTLKTARIFEYDIGILMCSDARMAALNSQYRGISGPTDVLSFSQEEGDPVPGIEHGGVRGDVVISLDAVQRNARELEIDVREETIRVAVHGVLHLVGYDHEGHSLGDHQAGTHPMFELQERIVALLTKELLQ